MSLFLLQTFHTPSFGDEDFDIPSMHSHPHQQHQQTQQHQQHHPQQQHDPMHGYQPQVKKKFICRIDKIEI